MITDDLPVINFDLDESAIAGKKANATKSKKPGGTFASMGLYQPVLKAVERKGYKLATPIQRKCIPPIREGKDVVAMARTGSGKSAAFLLPIIDKLKLRQPKAEIRALIISPTRELALQTLKFAREFTKFTNLTSKLIIGGESIGKDFETITSSPDILVATPGRLAHVLVEMKKKLDGLEIVVFDEADRLFEPGYKEMEQVNEICCRLNDTKQTLLFSATMPQRLADFAKADLKNPHFVRLDVESNLSETLKSIHLHCSQQDKFAVMIHLLKKFCHKEQMTVVFMPTRHHIEYAKSLLENTRLDCCYVYSSMDPEARRINIDRFTKKQCRVMLVTDIAARGIDIPLLDIVINFNFPFKPKLFIHRVGRVARAGRFGCAISLIAHDETPYLHALHIFFDQPVSTASQLKMVDSCLSLDDLPDKVLGTIPQEILDDENEILNRWLEHDEDLKAMVKVCDNSMKPYLKTREPPAPTSVKVAKDIHRKVIGVHPLFSIISRDETRDEQISEKRSGTNGAADQMNMLDKIKSYKPQATIFEVGHIKGNQRTEAFEVMQKKRQYHDRTGQKSLKSDSDEEEENFATKAKSKIADDSKFYLKYRPDDYVKEKGLELDKGNAFNNDLKQATFDLVADDENQMKRQRHQMIWDRKKKKYVSSAELEEKKPKRIKTESGAYISASYSSGLYDKWKSQSKVEQRASDDEDDEADNSTWYDKSKAKHAKRGSGEKQGKGRLSLDKLRSKLKPAKRRRELKNPEEILKARNITEKREAILRIKTMKKAQRNAERSGGGSNNATKSPKQSRGAKSNRKSSVSQGFKKAPSNFNKSGPRNFRRSGPPKGSKKGSSKDSKGSKKFKGARKNK